MLRRTAGARIVRAVSRPEELIAHADILVLGAGLQGSCVALRSPPPDIVRSWSTARPRR